MINFFDKIKKKILIFKFKKSFVYFNKYTRQAFKTHSDEEFKRLCWKCVKETAKQNKKDIKSVSLEDIYRVLYKIRKKFPKLLRRITLNQFLKTKNTLSVAGDVSNVIWFISSLTHLPLIYVVLKKIIGKRSEYVFKNLSPYMDCTRNIQRGRKNKMSKELFSPKFTITQSITTSLRHICDKFTTKIFVNT